ncbi:hypothetical protein [Dyadobacter sp. CY347]|uniref:hypothetical protein n=1 Tax=Dyadobacter sp. CY347 TaxID=2909336 RepID=UPI001F20DD79|nr:hypothetical protein [Dyadobacter sp. CY347]MCF2489921.1 hypothetical protein [Dyadobacter sp. CY347]
MTSEITEIIKIGASLLGGGAIGAVITNIVIAYRSRVQPIFRSVRVIPFFENTKFPNMDLSLALKGESKIADFTNLDILDIRMENNGNKDYQDFAFGVTLPDNSQIINFVGQSSDRHHIVQQETDVNIHNPKSEIDAKLMPFNRNDVYNITLLINKTEGVKSLSEADIKFSTNASIKFTSTRLSKTFLEVMLFLITDTYTLKRF